jgi:UDP-2-acetamido-2,6-beta-L-arabino-hexul-4-ose reductase
MDLNNLDIHQDERGSFVETFKLPSDGQVSYAITKPGELRGNHYHTRKTEYFSVIYGSATIAVKNRDTGDVIKVEVSGSKPMIAKIVPNHTHYLEATDEGCICIIWCDEQFDPKDPDTYPEEL